MTSAGSMHEAGHSKLVLWDNPEGWGGAGSESGVQDGGIHVHFSILAWRIHGQRRLVGSQSMGSQE